MRLTIVGCSGSYPGPDGPASSYLVTQTDEHGRQWRILLDLGNGALGALQRYTDPLGIDAVFLSHLHVDHCIDLTSFHVLQQHHPDGPRPAKPVWAPDGAADRMADAYGLPRDPGMRQQFDFRRHDEPVQVGPFTISPHRVQHPVEAYALRVEADGRVLAYSGDTGPSPGLVAAARDADLLLCEASFLDRDDNPPDVHLTGSQAAQAALAAGAQRLLLTHIPAWHDKTDIAADASTVWPGELELAEPGTSYDV